MPPTRRFIESAWPYRRGLLALVFALGQGIVDATPVCIWVDAAGRTHVSDTVPSVFQSSASCSDSEHYELTPSQQEDAARRTQDEQFRAKGLGVIPPESAGRAAPLTPPLVKRPTESVTDTTDCPTWWRIYDESSACFGPFRTLNGGLRSEAFAQCNAVESPELQCGPRRN